MTLTNYRKAVTVPCETATCPNYLTVGPDDFVPDPWTCPQCEDRQRDQHMDELERTTKANHKEQTT